MQGGSFTPISPYTPKAACITFGMWSRVRNVIIQSKFQLNWFRVFGAPGGRKSLPPIDWRYRPYNSVHTNVLHCGQVHITIMNWEGHGSKVKVSQQQPQKSSKHNCFWTTKGILKPKHFLFIYLFNIKIVPEVQEAKLGQELLRFSRSWFWRSRSQQHWRLPSTSTDLTHLIIIICSARNKQIQTSIISVNQSL